ncbi:hypothetical protein K32_34910 [Kaistia sp. 32K]|uniref:YdeI/OmpD-associated family protein n=1 Tax=Kaistia sp. 32K TaxID=2795690 RepID=UPI001916B477|nr:YdeI/OmpD-associated family protein [Kaistia sp. 32K]BCP54874.1 hypothetical protein K32_34910 [Kaistia sp. 32K]
MAAFIVDMDKVRTFAGPEDFYDWLSRNHASETEVWVRLHKKDSGIPSITAKEAVDVVLCWGWIDAIRKGLDQTSFLQRYTPRGKKSVWSQVNVDNVGRLVDEGRMTEHGLKHVEAAKADGRWNKAYRISGAEIPADLLAAIEADPLAKATFDGLSAQNRFALIFRLNNLKTEAGRQKRIAAFVDMLRRGEAIHPQKK